LPSPLRCRRSWSRWSCNLIPHARPATSTPTACGAPPLAIDRRAMTDVLLQRTGEAAVTVLPHWLTGYTALFPAATDRADA
jgi:hypothetical protein